MAEPEAMREELHFRRIDMRAWRRSDGLYEVESRVTDRVCARDGCSYLGRRPL